jgi:tetratricopeptide (TPR) repeat protein
LAKRKIRKKELKKPDEFITLSSKVIVWCQDNTRLLAAAAAVVAFLLIATSGFFVFRASRETKARSLYEQAVALYPADSTGNVGPLAYAASAAKLEEVKQRYGSTTVGINASVDLGNIYFQQAEYEKAITCYNDYLQSTDLTHSLHDQVLESLGETHEAKGAWQEALEVYHRLASEGTPVYKIQAQLYLGRVYESIGDQQEAMTRYQNYLKENPTALDGEWIRTKLRRWRQAEIPEQQG